MTYLIVLTDEAKFNIEKEVIYILKILHTKRHFS